MAQGQPTARGKAILDADDPAMGTVAGVLANIGRSRFSVVGHFALPDEAAWREDIFTPVETRVEELRGKYSADREAPAVLDRIAQEPAMHRRRSAYYAYESLCCFGQTGRLGPAPAIAGRSNARRIGMADEGSVRFFRRNVLPSVHAIHLASGAVAGHYISPLDRGPGAEPLAQSDALRLTPYPKYGVMSGQSILVAMTMSRQAKIFFSLPTGRLCASFAPRGAVRMLAAATPMSAGM